MLVACAVTTTTFGAAPARKPNIVLVVTDDQRWDTLYAMPTVRERLVGEGVTFSNAFAPTPLCAPGRASILTGLYAHHHGVRSLVPPRGGASAFRGADKSTIAVWLRRAGYRTGFFGKYLNSYWVLGPPDAKRWYVPPGWDSWNAMATEHYYGYTVVHEDGRTTTYGKKPEDYSTDVLAAGVLRFVRRAVADGRPFFVHFTPYAPHVETPGVFPAVAPRHQKLFEDLPPFRPPSYDEADVHDKPAWVRDLPRLDPDVVAMVDLHRRLQLQSLQAVDDAVARLLTLLRELGQDKNTVFVFTSDNGYCWAEHRYVTGKDCAFEECVRVPLVIRWPAGVPHQRAEGRFVLDIDLAPTLAALAGVTPPVVDGRSLVPLLTGSEVPWRDDFLLEGFNNEGLVRYRGLRTATWKYVENRDSGESELYDLLVDPYELDNRAADFPMRATIETLQERLHALDAAAEGPPPTR